MKPPIQYYDPDRLGPEAGLTKLEGVFHIRFLEEGKVKRRTLKTKIKNVAIKRRDDHIKYLKALGATPTDGVTDAKLNAIKEDPGNDSIYIYKRQPFRVKVKGVTVGETSTIEEAVSMRNKHLGI